MESKFDPNVSYHSVSPEIQSSTDNDSQRPKIELGNHPQLSQKRGIITTFVVQIFAILWLAPIIALLYLNFKGHIIGASAWYVLAVIGWPCGESNALTTLASQVPARRLLGSNVQPHPVSSAEDAR